jgi:hypothetical protein
LIHALQVVEKHNVERQYESIFQAMDRIAA